MGDGWMQKLIKGLLPAFKRYVQIEKGKEIMKEYAARENRKTPQKHFEKIRRAAKRRKRDKGTEPERAEKQ